MGQGERYEQHTQTQFGREPSRHHHPRAGPRAAGHLFGRSRLGEEPERETTPVSGDGLTVHYIDVGQGDSTLITCGGETMLIDAGIPSAGETVTDYLSSQGVTAID